MSSLTQVRNQGSIVQNNNVHIEKQLLAIIRKINKLITQANSDNMGTAARILCNAREELVYWAIDIHCNETATEQFVNKHLHRS